MSHNHTLGVICVLCSAVLFSAKSVLIKLAYQFPVNAETLLALRMLFSLPFFWACCGWPMNPDHA